MTSTKDLAELSAPRRRTQFCPNRDCYHQQYLVKVPHGYRCHATTGVPFPATD